MDPARRERVESLCLEALSKDERERAAFLDRACGPDRALRQEVESLLAGQPEADALLDRPGWAAGAAPLAPGTRLGPYEIQSFISAGGMGAVYKARDTRLGRTVAIKVLPPEFAAHPDRRRRFEQEARAASALNDAHICTLHDIGSDGGTDYLVMEYLDGETLGARLRKGPLSLDQALEYGTEIADALAKAHRQGIVHRDLKPGNVMLTKSGAKLLDFGLARLLQPSDGSGATATISATGSIVGTVPYMAPEQLEGKEVDARSDLFSFGAVLYEMVTGTRAFEGDSQASVIAAILEHDPAPLSSVQPLTPPALDRVVRRCLAKDPDQRWQTAADLAQGLRWVGQADAVSPSRMRGRRSPRVAVALLLLVLGVALGATVTWRSVSRATPLSSHLTFSIAESGLMLTSGGVAISPDGRTLVFAAQGREDQPYLYARRLDEWAPRRLEGTEGAAAPFFSPDGLRVAFMAGGMLKKVHLSEGAPQTICQLSYQGFCRGSWGTDDTIIVAQWPGAPLRISAEDGSRKPLPSMPADRRYLWPYALPDGKSVMWTIAAQNRPRVVAILPDGAMRPVLDFAATCARYLPSGHLVYEAEGRLTATPFDLERLRPFGRSRVVIDDIAVGFATVGSSAMFDYDVSATGTVVYTPASNAMNRLVWRDRTGRIVPLDVGLRRYAFPSLSADGRRVSVTVNQGTTTNVWAGSVDGPLTPLTSGGGSMCSVFSPDGRWVYFSHLREGGWSSLHRVRSDGSLAPELLLDAPAGQKPTCVSPQGMLLFNQVTAAADRRIMQLNLVRGGPSVPFGEPSGQEIEATVSPDGKWVAYQSDESGQWQIYVKPYPVTGARGRQVSTDGGMGPAWNPRGGGELFYQTRTAMMSVEVVGGSAKGPPVQLFWCRKSEDYRREFAVDSDGERFLFIEAATPRTEINVITNWFEELKTKVPTAK